MKLTRFRPNVNMLNHALKRSGVSRLNGLFMNDLEAAIVRLHPQLLRIKNRIQRWGIAGITFSGSGPALFGVTESRREARRWATALRGRYSRVFVAHTA